MNVSAICALLPADLQVATQVGFANTAHDAFTVPRSADTVFSILSYRNGTGNILGQKRSALFVVASLNVLSVCFSIFLSLSHFEIGHCISPFKIFYFSAMIHDILKLFLPLFGGLINSSLAIVEHPLFVVQVCSFFLERIEIHFFGFQLERDGISPCHNFSLPNLNVVQLHLIDFHRLRLLSDYF